MIAKLKKIAIILLVLLNVAMLLNIKQEHSYLIWIIASITLILLSFFIYYKIKKGKN